MPPKTVVTSRPVPKIVSVVPLDGTVNASSIPEPKSGRHLLITVKARIKAAVGVVTGKGEHAVLGPDRDRLSV